MKMKNSIIILALIVSQFCFIEKILAEPKSRTVGVKTESNQEIDPNMIDIPIEQWVGRKFIFLERMKNLQKYGYEFSGKPELFPDTDDQLKYSDHVGKTICVTSTQKRTLSYYLVSFVVEDSDEKIYGKAYKEHVKGIALYSELNNSKERWFGKTIYSKKKKITTYNEKEGRFGEIQVAIDTPLKVKDVWWSLGLGWDSVWLIVETKSGEQGFIGTSFSWTNHPLDQWTKNRPWEEDVFEKNPREIYTWDNATWDLVNSGKVRIGMNKEQVSLSWGPPQKINKDIYRNSTNEQWVYGNQYVYFENDIVTSMQNLQ